MRSPDCLFVVDSSAVLIVALLGGCAGDRLGELTPVRTSFPEIPVVGHTFHVNSADPSASDDNDGLTPTFDPVSGSGPWRTIRRAAATMSPGDATSIHGGVYRETDIRFGSSGTAEAPIQLRASSAAIEVVIDGGGEPGGVGIHVERGRHHIVIQGLVIQHMEQAALVCDGDPEAPSRGVVIRDVRARRNGSGLEFNAVDGLELHSVRCHDNERNGLTFERARSVVVRHCRISANGGHGVQVGREGEEERDSSEGLLFESVVSHDNQGVGFLLAAGTRGSTLRESFAYKNRHAGYLLISSSENTLERNVAFGNTEEGFVLQSRSTGNVITGNTAHHNGVNGFATVGASSKNTFRDNDSHSNGKRGFLVASESRENEFIANRAHHNEILGFGVYDRAERNVFERNDVHDNVYHGFALLSEANSNLFDRNEVHDNAACGFYFESCRENTFVDNEVHGNGLDGFAVFFESTGNVFRDNRSRHNLARGCLSDLSSVEDGWERDNQASGNGEGAFARMALEEVENLRAYTK
ncbi:MAG: right-handed parallel beta-helix repeat-containing protein [Planctomycetota bacterium]|nr:right-handed parallel beta-helix repeat-containing protein [Planctomycetota bacterium]